MLTSCGCPSAGCEVVELVARRRESLGVETCRELRLQRRTNRRSMLIDEPADLIRREHQLSVGENLTHESEVQVHDRVMIGLAHTVLL